MTKMTAGGFACTMIFGVPALLVGIFMLLAIIGEPGHGPEGDWRGLAYLVFLVPIGLLSVGIGVFAGILMLFNTNAASEMDNNSAKENI